MDFLFKLLFELIAEGTVELSKSKKVPKYIRYILIGIITLFFIAAIGLVFFVGLVVLKQNLFWGNNYYCGRFVHAYYEHYKI